MTTALPTPRFIVSAGGGDASSVDAYLYGENSRVLTYVTGPYARRQSFVTLIIVVTTGGFGAEAQADRLGSGLYGGSVFDTFEAAWAHLNELKELVLA